MMMLYWMLCTLVMITVDNNFTLSVEVSWIFGALMGMTSIYLRSYLESRVNHPSAKDRWACGF